MVSSIGDIDVVYTWVNHADSGWQELYAKATRGRIVAPRGHVSAVDPARFENHDELYWSIRSVHQHAPWVRHIYVLTNCILPDWAQAMPDVTKVSHEAVFPDVASLPTFNSSALETVLHRIPGLSDRFLYFNDDFFLCRDLAPEDFFGGGEGVYFTISPHDIPYQREVADLRPVDTGAIEAAKLLQRDFDFTPAKKLQHTPYALSRHILQEIESRYSAQVQKTRASTFRNPDDLAMATTMHAYYAQCTGRGKPGRLRARYIDIDDWRFLGLIHPWSPLMRGHYDTLCLNQVSHMRFGGCVRNLILQWVMRRLFL